MIQARANAAQSGQRRRRHHHHRNHRRHDPRVQELDVESSSGSSDGETSEEAPPRCRLINDITKSNKFSLAVATMIMLNVIVMGLQANFQDLYLPWSCTTETQAYRGALIRRIAELKKAPGGHEDGRRLAWQARRHRWRRLSSSTTVQLHILCVDGFPDSADSQRSFLNGYYRERLAPEYRLGNRSTFWELGGQRYIFYCPRVQSWGIGSLLDYQANSEGQCVWGASTPAGADVLNASSARFTSLYTPSSGWTAITGAGVVDVQTEVETAAPSATSTTPPPSASRAQEVLPVLPPQNFSLAVAVRDFALEQGCVDLWGKVGATFLLFFVVELALRLVAHGRELFASEDKAWNLFDLAIVLLGCVDTVARLLFDGHASSRLVLMVRVVRILRILRVLRLFREFRKLTMLVRGLVESFTIVFWICLLMLLFMIVYAVFCTHLVGHAAGRYHKPEDREQVEMYFGSVLRSTITLFQFLTLDNWSGITRLVWTHQPIMLPLFLIYVVGVSLVVVSLLTGVMAEHMNTVRESEEALEEQERQTKLIKARRALYEAFKRVDVDKNKTINFEEFESLIRDGAVKEELSSIDLNLERDFDPEELFGCFDQDFDGLLTWSEFRDGMEELRQPAGRKQLFKLQAAVQKIVTHQVQAETAPRPGGDRRGAAEPSRRRTMAPAVERRIGEAHEAMDGVQETLDDLEGDLKEFVAELRWRRRRPGPERCEAPLYKAAALPPT